MKFKNIVNFIVFLLIIEVSNAAIFNATNLTNAQNPYEQAVALNDITGGLVGIVIILIVFIPTFIIILKNTEDILSGVAGAAWFSAFTATLLLPMNLLPFWIYQYVLLLMGIAVFLSALIGRLRGP